MDSTMNIPLKIEDSTAQSEHEHNINTALHIAIMRQDYDTVQSLLLRRPADVNIKNSDGKTALDLAKELNTDIGRQLVVLLTRIDKTINSKLYGKFPKEVEPFRISRLSDNVRESSAHRNQMDTAASTSFYKTVMDYYDSKDSETNNREVMTLAQYSANCASKVAIDSGIGDEDKTHTFKILTKADKDEPNPSAHKSMCSTQLSVPCTKHLEQGAQTEFIAEDTQDPFESTVSAQLIEARIDLMKENSLNLRKNETDIMKSELRYLYYSLLYHAVIRGDIETVKLYLNEGAINFINADGKTILDVAKELNTKKGNEIVDLLKAHITKSNTSYDFKTSDSLYLTKSKKLYLTKLLSLVFYRASTIKDTRKFILGSNFIETGPLNNLHIRYEEEKKETMILFLEVIDNYDRDVKKITCKDLWEEDGDLSLMKYFNSYLKKRKHFCTKSPDIAFEGLYEDVKCYFILYTTLSHDLDERKCTDTQSEESQTMRYLISTYNEHFNIFQYKYDEREIGLLTKCFLKERLNSLAVRLLHFVRPNHNSHMMADYQIRMHHLLLAKNVIETTHSYGKFRSDFLTSNDEMLILLREALYSEAVIPELDKDTINQCIRMILFHPNVDNISKLIGNVIFYNKQKKRLEIVMRELNCVEPKLREGLAELQISQTVARRAMEIAGFEKLRRMRFYIPVTFGKFSFNVVGDNIEKSLDTFAAKLEVVIKGSSSRNILIDESVVGTNKPLKPGDMEVDSSIGFPIMNLLILDEDTNSLVFNLNEETLEPNAQLLLDKLRRRIENLESYRLQLNLPGMPRLSFGEDAYEIGLAKNFLNDLWFFTHQANEVDLDKITKNEILEHILKLPLGSSSE